MKNKKIIAFVLEWQIVICVLIVGIFHEYGTKIAWIIFPSLLLLMIGSTMLRHYEDNPPEDVTQKRQGSEMPRTVGSAAKKADQPVLTVESDRPAKEAINPVSREEAIQLVRSRAIKALGKENTAAVPGKISSEIRLTVLSEPEAARCFPQGFPWFIAEFMVQLPEMELFADASTYPNQFGAVRSHRFFLSPGRFHEIAKQFSFPPDLQYMETEEDWKAVMNDELAEALAAAKKAKKEAQEKQAQKKRDQYALVIPTVYEERAPEMLFDEVVLELEQEYGATKTKLIQQDGAYQATKRKIYYHSTSTHPDRSRTLKPMEAVWIEEKITEAIHDPSEEVWTSLAGLDVMTVKVMGKGKTCVEIVRQKPLQKYYDLLNQIELLAEYESFSQQEAEERSISRQ